MVNKIKLLENLIKALEDPEIRSILKKLLLSEEGKFENVVFKKERRASDPEVAGSNPAGPAL